MKDELCLGANITSAIEKDVATSWNYLDEEWECFVGNI
jgi:hypothetical protein